MTLQLEQYEHYLSY